jgi:Transposase, Mutator family
LIAWGLTLEGQKVLLALQLRSRESYESWLDFGRDLTKPAVRAPALVIADEAAEIWKATRELWPNAIKQTLHSPRPQDATALGHRGDGRRAAKPDPRASAIRRAAVRATRTAPRAGNDAFFVSGRAPAR